jgi:Zn-dependent metalloprotease
MKSRVILSLFFALLVTRQSDIKASTDIARKIEHPYSSIPELVIYTPEGQPYFSSVEEFFKQEFGMDEALGFRLIDSFSDGLGLTHKRYIQTYQGIPIDLADVILHLKEEKVVSFNGLVYKNLNLSVTAEITKDAAIKIAKQRSQAEIFKWELAEEERFLQWESGDPNATFYPQPELVFFNNELNLHPAHLRLCYEFEIYVHQPLAKHQFYVDATNGEVLFVEDLIHHGNTPATGKSAYSGTVPIVTDSLPTHYRLRESSRGKGVQTFDLNNSTSYNNAVDFTDSTNSWNKFSPSIDIYAIDAHWGTEKTYDYFYNIHFRNSIDNRGFLLRSYIHYGSNYVNAFWDGQRMTYGDGDSRNSPLTTLDITGHEIAHGLTNFSSRLIYANESGALNESFSDIFGTAVEQYARPGNWNWLVGEDIGGAFRSMSNPKQYNDPDTYNGTNWVNQNCIPTSGNDKCGVHTNSGVQNKWFYLLSQGGSGTNDLGDPYQVTGLGILKAGKIAFRNNTVYLRRSSGFSDARFYSILSAIDLYGACSKEVESVTNAWYAVGVGNAYSPGVSSDFVATFDTSYCEVPATVAFNSNGSNVINFLWDFGDGDTSTQADPVHTYTAAGVYTVSLFTEGRGCGNDTTVKVNYVNIDTANPCSYYLDEGLINSSDCQGNFYDGGGLNSEYPLDRYDTLFLQPVNADFIVLKLPYFQVEGGDYDFCNHDYLEVYDGGLTDPLIGRFCADNPPPDSLVSSSNKMSLLFYSDKKVANPGFRGMWYCGNANVPPQAEFAVKFDSSCSGKIQFYDQSRNGVSSRKWDFGDGTFSTEANPMHHYRQSGSYTVSLFVQNSSGADTLVKGPVEINLPPSPNTVNDTACLGGNWNLQANGSGKQEWFISSSSKEKVYTGSTLALKNRFSDTTLYVESLIESPRIIGVPFTISGSGNYSSKSEALYFDVHRAVLLESVILKSNRSGNRRIDLRNKEDVVIASKEILLPSTALQVPLNFELQPDSGYSLSIGSREPDLYLNTSGFSYPHAIGNYMTLTGNTISSTAYPFFYYMAVRDLPCRSQRTSVQGIIDSSCTLVGAPPVQADDQFKLYPNPVSQQLIIHYPYPARGRLNLYNFAGRLVAEKKMTEPQLQLDVSHLANGLYFLQITHPTGQFIRRVNVIH